jgi:hypothetical protein
MRDMGEPHVPESATTPTPPVPPIEPAQKIRVSFFVYMILTAILLYVGSGGPAAYVAVVSYRTMNRAEWIKTAFYTIYRPHLDLCYRRQGYFDYINWFIVKAGGNGESHADFKRHWEVEAGYRSAPAP